MERRWIKKCFCAKSQLYRRELQEFLDGSQCEIKRAGPRSRPKATWPPPSSRTHNRSTVIGPCKLLEQIGEGGMGTVWMAEQREPVRRLVALKLIKPGMDLARPCWPGLRPNGSAGADGSSEYRQGARCGGTTDDGRPYFVMELVRGIPLDAILRRAAAVGVGSGSNCSCRSARPCSMPIKRGSSTATSSPRTFW